MLKAEDRTPARFEKPLQVTIREGRLLREPPFARSLGKLTLDMSTEGWRFPSPTDEALGPGDTKLASTDLRTLLAQAQPAKPDNEPAAFTRVRPPQDSIVFKDRLLYLLQPPLENLFASKQVHVPFKPYPYQLEGIAFLMPRHSALLADEMGLGKTMQTILSLRLLFQSNLIHRALLICPKALVNNWCRELRVWAEDLPFEVIGGDAETRRQSWLVSKCPLKLINYELLTRDANFLAEEQAAFDVVVLDEAQRIKNHDSKTAQVVRSVKRQRSWALTGTPIENRPEDLINVFAFVDENRIPLDTPPKMLAKMTGDCILRRTKDDVLTELPPKTIRDASLELTPAQRESYQLAENEGVVRLNALGETITVQHVFELIMRLKQICNFDPLTGQSSKLEQLQADMAEVAESGRKAIVFSQWVQPLELISEALKPYGPLQYHGKVPSQYRQAILDQFRNDPSKHVLLMSYGTGSVGLNLQFASYVFLFDRWWNPAIEDQAINRAHRLGQREPVFVTRFLAQGTIEDRIADVLEKKRQLFLELLAQSEGPSALGMSQDEIFGLFEIKARPKKQAA